MGIIIDILILLFFALCIKRNYRKQQLRCGLETLASAIAMFLSVPLSTGAAELMYTMIFRSALAHNLESVVGNSLQSESQISAIARVMNVMPSVITNAAGSYQTTMAVNVAEVERLVNSGVSSAAVQIVDIVAGPVIQGIFRAVFCMVLYWGLSYLLKSLGAVVENLVYTPELAVQNGVLCGVFGCVKGLIALTLAVAVLQLVLPALPSIPIFNAETLSQSFLFRLFYHQNILMLFLGRGIYPTAL